MSVQVTNIGSHTHPEWGHYVSGHPQATFFHTLAWRDAVAESFGHTSCYLMARQDGRLVGVFPLTRVTSRLAGTILVSVPYGVYGGVLADDVEAQAALMAHARTLADRLGAQWMDIRCMQRQCDDLPVVTKYVTFRKELPMDPAEVLPSLPRKARAAARQARERYQLEVDFDDAHLDTIWSLYSQSMRRLASLNYPLRFFQTLAAYTQPVGDGAVGHRQGEAGPRSGEAGPAHLVQMVRYRGRPIAGLLSFIYRGTLIPYFSGCDERYQKYHPNNFMYLTAMEKGVELGCREFDFGRSRVDNTGSYDFKRFQGFEPTPLNYQYYVPKGGRAPNLHPSNPRLALARRVWPRLPLAVTRPLGAWLAKSIPG